jgi:hypothetical protein
MKRAGEGGMTNFENRNYKLWTAIKLLELKN